MSLNTVWKDALSSHLNSADFKALLTKINTAYLDKSQIIYPPRKELFRAFNKTPLDKVQVVILGQDPYHNPGQAHGLCFSVPESMMAPPSLRNIFKELESDVGSTYENTDLTHWATQGVFLLNTALSVLENQPTSHSKIGWEEFTDHVIETISESQEHVVFMLWGAHAQGKAPLIDPNKNLILKAPHPSPLSAYRGFFGCRHFSKANNYLKKYHNTQIKW